MKAETRRVTHVFHPTPVGEHLALNDAGVNARVAVGEPGYQLDSGEIIAL